MAWSRYGDPKAVGRVIVGRRCVYYRPSDEVIGRSVIGMYRVRAQRRALNLRDERESPVSKWRRSMYNKKGMRKPKHPRVRLREQVAREQREIQTLARRYAKAGIEIAAEIMGDPTQPASARLQAIDLLENRAYGKPNQTNTNLNIDANGKPREVSSDELDRRIEEALGAIAAVTGRAGKAPKGKEQPSDLFERDRNPDGSEPQLH